MKLEVIRYNKTSTHTDGLLFIDGKFECYTLEDAEREIKVYAETCIPEGLYKVTLRTEGGWHSKEAARYSFHKGMLWVRDVPEFEYILIHAGNTSKNTAGCLLVGSSAHKDNDFIASSRDAYEEMYKKVIKAFDSGEDVSIEYISI